MAPNDGTNYWITNIANYFIIYDKKYSTSYDKSMTKTIASYETRHC